MRFRKRIGAKAVLVAVAGCACVLAAQTSKNPISTKPEGTAPTCTYSGSASGGKATGSSNCPATAPGTDPNLYVPPNAAQRFPFPGSQPDATAPTAQNSGTQANPATPDAPGQNALKRFPFPGEAPAGETPVPSGNTPAAPPAPGSSSSPLQDAGSSGSSSSSNSSSSSSSSSPGFSSSNPGPDLPDDDPNAPMPTPKHHVDRKKLPHPEKVLNNDEREAEDLQVAGFYQNNGNFTAAYQRSKEATDLVPDDPEAHLSLAEAARKLGKLDEAEQNYKKALTLDPVPKVRKAAEKALKEMSGS